MSSTATTTPHGENTSNETEWLYEVMEVYDGLRWRIFEFLLYLFLLVAIDIFSILAILIVKRTPALHSAPGMMIGFIAICDFTVTTLVIGNGLYPALTRNPYSKTVGVFVAVTFASMQSVNAFTLMVSAMDRLFSIVWPFTYPNHFTIKRIIGLFVVLIIAGCIWPTTWILYNTYKKSVWYDEQVYMYFLVSDNDVFPLVSLFLFLTPGIIVLICYIIIVVIVVQKRISMKKQMQVMQSNRRSSSQANYSKGKEFLAHISACKMLFVVTILYFLSFFPYMFVDWYIINVSLVPPYIYKITTWFIFIESLFNFTVFYKMNANFKTGAKKLLHRFYRSKAQFFQNYLPAKYSSQNGLLSNNRSQYRCSFTAMSPRTSMSILPQHARDKKHSTDDC